MTQNNTVEFTSTDGVVHPRNPRIDDEVNHLVNIFGELPLSRMEISMLLAQGQTREDIYSLACDSYCSSQDESWENVVEYSCDDFEDDYEYEGELE